ncbi:MAG: hypothetical protein ACAH59_09990 [Pseudobdellovibrionaceae bacterium]
MNFTKFFLLLVLSMVLTNCGPKADLKESDSTPAPTTPTTQTPEVEPQEPEPVDPLLHADLLAMQWNEAHKYSPARLKEMNEKAIDQVYALPVQAQTPHPQGRYRLPAIDPVNAQKIIESMNIHPVVAYSQNEKYDRETTEIGYCFGRATYAHLVLLKMGIMKESIRKVWLVGPMSAGGTNWAFHVATIVRTTNGKWMVIDNYANILMELREWVYYFYPQNKGYDNLRVYITTPSKFSVNMAKYDRVQLGLNLSAVDDWYRHYFVDLMNWFKDHDISEVGLRDLRKDPKDEKNQDQDKK